MYGSQPRQTPVTAPAWANPRFLVLLFRRLLFFWPLPAAFLLQQRSTNSGRRAGVWRREKLPGRHEEEGAGVEAILQNKASPEFGMLLLNKDCASRVLIIRVLLWYNICIYCTEYYIHYAGRISSIFLEDSFYLYFAFGGMQHAGLWQTSCVTGEGAQGEKEGGENLTEITPLSVWVRDVMKSVCCASCLQIGL